MIASQPASHQLIMDKKKNLKKKKKKPEIWSHLGT
jgi:hypothetical protein